MSEALVALFAPYCKGSTRPGAVDEALRLLASGELQGFRQLRPEGQRTFTLRWQPGVAPLEPSHVQLEVRRDEAAVPFHYRFQIPTHRLVAWLMEWQAVVRATGSPADLPESFWQWLILGREPTVTRN